MTMSRMRRLLIVPLLTLALVGTGSTVTWANVDGIDIARYQHPNGASIDWDAVRNDGKRYVIVKATEGRSYTNPYFRGDFSDALAAGVVHGAYHFARPDASAGDAAAEARYYVSVAGTMQGRNSLPPVLDLEANGGLSDAAMVEWVRTWLTTVENLTGRTPMIYTGRFFWNGQTGNNTTFTRYPLWIAHYTSASAPNLPVGWTHYTMWQWTSSGSVAGIQGRVDLNRFAGTEGDLAAFSNGLATTLSLRSSDSGTQTRLSGALTSADGATMSGRTVRLLARPVGTSTWVQQQQATTGAGGGYAFTVNPAEDTQYRVRFAGESLRLAASSPTVTVTKPTPVATRLEITADAGRIVHGQSTTVRGTLTANGSGLDGQTVRVLARPVGSSTWSTVGQVTTTSGGAYTLRVAPTQNTEYTARFAGTSSHQQSQAGTAVVEVAPAVTASLSNTQPRVGDTVTLSGRVTPPHSGQVVYRERFVNGAWVRKGVATLSTTGQYSWPLRPRQRVSQVFRVVKPADADHARGVSPTVVMNPR